MICLKCLFKGHNLEKVNEFVMQCKTCGKIICRHQWETHEYSHYRVGPDWYILKCIKCGKTKKESI